jgi:tetratricopeptide (TPR) repeat protein
MASIKTGRRRHAAYYQKVLEAASTLYLQGGEGVIRGLALFDQERTNIEAGHAWAVEQPDNDEAAAGLCITYPDAGVDVLDLRQHPRERIQWLEVMRVTARRLKQRDAEGQALSGLGGAYSDLGETLRAIEFFEQVLAIARETGDRSGEGYVLWNKALALDKSEDRTQAIVCAEEALVILEEIESPHADKLRKQLAVWH